MRHPQQFSKCLSKVSQQLAIGIYSSLFEGMYVAIYVYVIFASVMLLATYVDILAA